MRINLLKLFLALSSCLVFLSPRGQAVEPDALTQADAIQKAISQNKMILLIVSDTNNCTGCRTLEFGTLPSTNRPTMRQFLGESFIYWACGPEQNCTEFRTYAGTGTLPLPMFFIIDPRNPQSYYPGYGDSDPNMFYNWARIGLLKMTKPVVSTPQQNQTFPDKTILVQGRSISTNVTIRGLYSRLNSGAWTYSTVPDGINWGVTLDPARVENSNVVQVYAVDGSQNRSQTNAVNFSYSPGKTPATVTLSDLFYFYDGNAKRATATTSPAGLAVILTYDGSTPAPINAGSYTVVGTINDPNYQGSATNMQVIGRANQTINFAPLERKAYRDASFELQATASSGLPVSYASSKTAVATIAGTTVAIVGVGSTTITASQAGNANYNAATAVDQTLDIGKANQTIAFEPLAERTYLDEPFELNATASSGLLVSYVSSKPTVAMVSGTTVTIVGVGSTTITASQAGDANYNVAVTVNKTLVVNAIPASVTLDGLSHTYDGTAKAATVTTTPESLAITVTYDGSTTVPINAHSYAVVATVSDPHYAGSTSGTLVIAQATASVTLTNLLHIYDGTAKTATATTTPPGLTVNLTYDGLTNAPINTGDYTVSGTVNDLNYAGSATNTLIIREASPVITLLAPDVVTVPVVGDFNFYLEVYGSNFVQNSVVLWNGTKVITATEDWESGFLFAFVDTNLITSFGSRVSITVSNPPSAGGVSPAQFLYIGERPGLPVITLLAPDPVPVPVGTNYIILKVTGSNFVQDSVVLWRGTKVTTKYDDSGFLSAFVFKNLVPPSGSLVSITVSNPPPEGGVSSMKTVFIGGPKLTLAGTNDLITIDWPKEAIGFKLQSSTNLPANWQDVPESDTTNSVGVTNVTSTQFYRLKK